jgi:hypothetical protein
MRRIKNMNPAEIIRTAILASIGFFILWMVLVALGWLLFRLAGVDPDFWGSLEGLASSATLATVVGGGFVALAQLAESVDSREREIVALNMDTYNSIFERMMSEENIAARRWIYENLPPDPAAGLSGLSEEGRRHVKLVLNSFDHLGFLIQQDWLTGDEIIAWVSPFVVKTWAKLEAYVDHEAARREEPDYYEAVRDLARRCKQWREAHGLPTEPTWVQDAM